MHFFLEGGGGLRGLQSYSYMGGKKGQICVLPIIIMQLEFVFYVKTDVSPLSTCMSKICKQEL